MKLLILGENADYFSFPNATFSDLSSSNPFGFDTILVDPFSSHTIAGTNQANSIYQKWNEWLNKWLTSNHRIIILMRPYNSISGSHNNYDWMPLDGFNARNLQSSGGGNYLGSIVAKDSYLKNYLQDDEIEHSVQTHFKNTEHNDHIHINSKIDDETITSFTWRDNGAEIIFLPVTNLSTVRNLIESFDTAANRWKIPKAVELESSISKIDTQIDQLQEERQKVQIDLNALNRTVSQQIDSNVYLSQAVRAYDQVIAKENPNPTNFYAAIEAIEKSFDNEVDMRDTLGFSKTQISKLTRRTNDFRHVAKSGIDPIPLSADEIEQFTELTEQVIASYINYSFISS